MVKNRKTDMEIQQKDNGRRGLFFMEHLYETIAKITYTWEGEKMIISHTYVNAAYQSKGLGKQLVEHVIKYARENNIQIEPVCPFVQSVMNTKNI